MWCGEGNGHKRGRGGRDTYTGWRFPRWKQASKLVHTCGPASMKLRTNQRKSTGLSISAITFMHRIAGRCRGPPAMENIKQTCLQPAPLGKPAGRRNQHQSARSQHSVITLIRQGRVSEIRNRKQPKAEDTAKDKEDNQRQGRPPKTEETTKGKEDNRRQRRQPKAEDTTKGKGDSQRQRRQHRGKPPRLPTDDSLRSRRRSAQGIEALKASKRSRRRRAQGVEARKASKRSTRRSAQGVEARKASKRSRRRSAQGVEALKALKRSRRRTAQGVEAFKAVRR